jgi:hypothetical protein
VRRLRLARSSGRLEMTAGRVHVQPGQTQRLHIGLVPLRCQHGPATGEIRSRPIAVPVLDTERMHDLASDGNEPGCARAATFARS